MKKWTVMLIPHDRGSTQTLTISNVHCYTVVVLLAILTFATAFLFQRSAALAAQTDLLREANQELEITVANRQPEMAPVAQGLSEVEARQIEDRLRAEYDATIGAITAELGQLYDLEAKARNKTGLEPRAVSIEDVVAVGGGGKGGSSGVGQVFAAVNGDDAQLRPPHVIYGMVRPSADLIRQEIRLRTQSIKNLVQDIETREDHVARVPTIWPLAKGAGKVSSNFGYRRDPFTWRVRHHEGTDISAPSGTQVRATGKGIVKSSGYDGDYGNLVCIDHGNGLETWYAHLSKRLVQKGQVVERYDIIGNVGSTGRSTGAHLHYEVHKSGKAVNAAPYLD